MATKEQIMEVFPNRGKVVTVEEKWKNLGSPNGVDAMVEAAKVPLPTKYDSKEAAQADGATAGARSGGMLAKAAIACYANQKGLKPGSKLEKLEKDFDGELDEYFKLCGVKRP